jgi:Mrp family chromosome partitioning ATPase
MSETITTNGAFHAAEPARAPSEYSATANAPRRSMGRVMKRRRGAEPFDALLWRLMSRRAHATQSTTIGLIGCDSGAGVTTIAANLAARASELQLGPVLLVETVCERPRLSAAWKLPRGPGLAELLAGEAAFADCLRSGPAGDLHVLPAASGRRKELPAWDALIVEALLAECSTDHKLVLFDLPTADRLDHATLLAKRLDEVLLVVRAERTRGPEARRVVDRLLEDGVPLKGAVLNRQRRYVPRWLNRWL